MVYLFQVSGKGYYSFSVLIEIGYFATILYARTSNIVDFTCNLSLEQVLLPITRMTRSSVLEVMRSDYVLTAYAKGLSTTQVVIKHILKMPLFQL